MICRMARFASQESKSRWASRYTLTVAVAVVIASLWVIAGGQQESLTFVTPSGDKLTLSGLRGKVVVLIFSGIQDPQCRDELKALNFLVSKYQDKPVSLYWVSINPPGELNSESLTPACGSPGSAGILGDPAQTAFKRFSAKIPQLPTTVVIDKEGRLNGQPIGGFNPDTGFLEYLSNRIDPLLESK